MHNRFIYKDTYDALLKEYGVTNTEMAKLLGTTRNSLRCRLNGERSCTVEWLMDICEKLSSDDEEKKALFYRFIEEAKL